MGNPLLLLYVLQPNKENNRTKNTKRGKQTKQKIIKKEKKKKKKGKKNEANTRSWRRPSPEDKFVVCWYDQSYDVSCWGTSIRTSQEDSEGKKNKRG